MFIEFIGKGGAPVVGGMKFGARLAGVDVGILPPYGELEYGV